MNDLLQTRTTLIGRLKNWQDEPSWQDFFDRYWRLIYVVALKSGLTETEAEDVVQETMIAVAKRMPSFKYDRALGSFKTWLLNLIRWRVIDQLRKRAPLSRSRGVRPEPVTGTAAIQRLADQTSQDLGAVLDAEWERNLLDTAIATIRRSVDPQKFQIFDLCVNKEWPPAKVAQVFGISTGQVYLVKHRMTELIKEEVKRVERGMI